MGTDKVQSYLQMSLNHLNIAQQKQQEAKEEMSNVGRIQQLAYENPGITASVSVMTLCFILVVIVLILKCLKKDSLLQLIKAQTFLNMARSSRSDSSAGQPTNITINNTISPSESAASTSNAPNAPLLQGNVYPVESLAQSLLRLNAEGGGDQVMFHQRTDVFQLRRKPSQTPFASRIMGPVNEEHEMIEFDRGDHTDQNRDEEYEHSPERTGEELRNQLPIVSRFNSRRSISDSTRSVPDSVQGGSRIPRHDSTKQD